MKETEYIFVENKTYLQIALKCLYDCMSGEKHGVNSQELQEAYRQVHAMLQKMYGMLDLEE